MNHQTSTILELAAALASASLVTAPTVLATPIEQIHSVQNGTGSVQAPTASLQSPTKFQLVEERGVHSFLRETTSQECSVGEIRSWALWSMDWDGEGALAPNQHSITQSVAFVRLIDSHVEVPEPMLLASGNVAVYWRREGYYFELEFHGDKGVSYFAETDDGRHKGMVKFDENEIPLVLKAILEV